MKKFLPKNISKNNPNHSIPLVGLSSFGTLLDSNLNNVVKIKKGK